MQSIVTAAATALALALVSPATCQESKPNNEASAEVTAKKAPFVFEAGDTELVKLVERCGAYLQYNILFDLSELQSSDRGRRRGGPALAKNQKAEDLGPIVSLQLPVVTDRDGCEDLLSSMLWSYGLSLVALDEQKAVYEVLSRNGQRAREIVASGVRRLPEQVLARPMLRSYVTTVVQLKHLHAQLANNALRPFFATQNTSHGSPDSLVIGNLGNKSAVLISGPQFMVASAIKMLHQADVPEREIPSLIEKRFEEVVATNTALRRRIESLEKQMRARK